MGQIGWSAFTFDTLTRRYSFVESSHMPVAKDDKPVPAFVDNYYETNFNEEDETAPF